MRGKARIWKLRFERSWKKITAISVGVTVAAAVCQKLDWLGMRDAEIGAYDQGLSAMTAWTSHPSRSDDVVIVAIDDATFQGVAANPSYRQNFGSWPYSRNVWARVFEHLKKEGARAVVFDAVMDEPGSDPAGDDAMATVIGQEDVPFYLGFSTSAGNKPLPAVTPANVPLHAAATPAPAATASDEFPSDDFPSDDTPAITPDTIAKALAFPVTHVSPLPRLEDEQGRAEFPQPPIPALIPVGKGFGLVRMEEDGDGKLRRTRFAYTDGANDYATLSLAVAADLAGASAVTLAPGALTIGDRRIPINGDGTAEIDFRGGLDETFHTTSMLNVLDDWAYDSRAAAGQDVSKTPRRLTPGYFKDKVVLIAGFAVGTADVKATPFETHTPGVAKIAAEIQNFLDGRFIVEAPFWFSVLVTLAVAFFSVSIIVVVRSMWLEIGWPLLLFYGFFVVTGLFLVHGKVHILSAMPSWAASLASVLGTISNHVFAEKERDRIARAFAHSIGGHHLEELVEHAKLPDLSGERREVTVLITDIRHFGEIARGYEKDPKALLHFLNRYLTTVTDVLLEHGGCICSYRGDSAVCLFGAPMPHADHALRAAKAALDVEAALERLKAELPPQEREQVRTRIGVYTGTMFVGNFGSHQIIDYTAIGDGMVATSRIERANETLGTQILVSKRSVELIGSALELREAARIALLPGAEPEAVYELKGSAASARPVLVPKAREAP